MTDKYSEQFNIIIKYSIEEAIRLGSDYTSAEHFFLGILRHGDNKATQILTKLNVNLNSVKKEIESIVKSSRINIFSKEAPPLTKQADTILKIAYLEALETQNKVSETEHLMLSILKQKDCIPSTILLNHYNIDYIEFRNELTGDQQAYNSHTTNNNLKNNSNNNFSKNKLEDDDSGLFENSNFSKTKTPVLDNFGRDITKMAEEGKLDPIIGRDEEIERVSQILSRRKKNNPILIGEPGVGKTAIIEGLALRIINKKISRILFNKKIISLDLAALVAGTKYRGQFEERIKNILVELSKNKDIILFIDEIHTIIGAGGASGSLDAGNILKPSLARGEIQCIGASTLDEYRKHIEKDGALDRRFQRVIIEPPSIQDTITILKNIKSQYEEYHSVKFSDEAIEACVKLSDRYITDRLLPDKAIDVLDEAGARIHIKNINVPQSILELEEKLDTIKNKIIINVEKRNLEEAVKFKDEEEQIKKQISSLKKEWEKSISSEKIIITEDVIADVIKSMTGIPLNKMIESESNKLKEMSGELKKRIIGQDEAINKVVKAIQRNRVGLKSNKKPIGSFIFLGNTGVGKTELTKALADYLFDSSGSLIKIDMSEYMEKFNVSRLIGAPPGYVGYEEGGLLTEKVRRKPYSVILLDEIEKAHPEIFNVLLQVFDEGILTDGLGRKIDFKNTIIIMTSNIGIRQLKDFGEGVGFATSKSIEESEKNRKAVIEKALKKTFSPEFLNRIDEIVVFNSLEEKELLQIIEIRLQEFKNKLIDINVKINIDEDVKKFLVSESLKENYGARPLQRAIQNNIEDLLTDELLDKKNSDIISFNIKLNKEKDKVIIKQKAKN